MSFQFLLFFNLKIHAVFYNLPNKPTDEPTEPTPSQTITVRQPRPQNREHCVVVLCSTDSLSAAPAAPLASGPRRCPRPRRRPSPHSGPSKTKAASVHSSAASVHPSTACSAFCFHGATASSAAARTKTASSALGAGRRRRSRSPQPSGRSPQPARRGAHTARPRRRRHLRRYRTGPGCGPRRCRGGAARKRLSSAATPGAAGVASASGYASPTWLEQLSEAPADARGART